MFILPWQVFNNVSLVDRHISKYFVNSFPIYITVTVCLMNSCVVLMLPFANSV